MPKKIKRKKKIVKKKKTKKKKPQKVPYSNAWTYWEETNPSWHYGY
jgi:hypothetical protein